MLWELSGGQRYQLRRGYLAVRRGLSATTIDRRLGIETSHDADLGALRVPERVRYEPSGWLDLRRILRLSDVMPGDVFVDLGSGKGRVVLQAARYPFKRVIGVEIAADLSEIAGANVRATRERRRLACEDIELVTADILEYELPPDVTVAYMYNPVRGRTFELAIDRLISALDERPRPFRLIYSTPVEHDRLMGTGRFEVVREVRGLRPGKEWSRRLGIRMYALVPE